MSKLSDHILYNAPLDHTLVSDSMVHSIIRNIQNILNTRSSVGIKKFLSEDTVLDNLTFGLPDLSFLSIASGADKKILENTIKKAIATFEPRLKGVSIELGMYNSIKREIIVKVSASFNRDNLAMNFILNLSTLEFLINERER